MVDEEVEKTLRQIQERVRKTTELPADSPITVVSGDTNGSNISGNESEPKTSETMARIDAYLTTTARAWDRLPPLVSNRSGGLARLELWVKRRFKQATRWYSWEQINFNAAVHHALRDTLGALLDLERQLAAMRAKTEAQLEQHKIDMMSQRAEIESQQAEIESQRAEIGSQRAEIESQRFQTEAYRAQVEAQQRTRGLEINARLAESLEREEQRLEEQRVCFKQLSLEMSEAKVLLDRARRDIESRLNTLEKSK